MGPVIKPHAELLFAAAVFITLTAAAASVAAHQLPEGFSGFEDPASCAPCHKAIYDEWAHSMHAKSSKFADPVHSAVHEAFYRAMLAADKKPDYFCASCHAPTADNMDALIRGDAAPDPGNPTNTRGVTCSFCHKVDGLVEGERFHTYKVTEGIKGPDGQVSAPHGSQYSEFASSYMMCLGCHGKMVNDKGGVVCGMDEEGYSNCLDCHMSKADGPPAEGSAKSVHAFHGIAGAHDPGMLKKGAAIGLAVEAGKLLIVLTNPNTHMFPSSSPLRMSYFKVEVFDSAGKLLFTNFNEKPAEDPRAILMKSFRSGDKTGVPPWEAEGTAGDTRLAPKEQRIIAYGLPPGAVRAKAMLFYRFLPPAAIEKFGIPADGSVEKPHLVSESEIEIK